MRKLFSISIAMIFMALSTALAQHDTTTVNFFKDATKSNSEIAKYVGAVEGIVAGRVTTNVERLLYSFESSALSLN